MLVSEELDKIWLNLCLYKGRELGEQPLQGTHLLCRLSTIFSAQTQENDGSMLPDTLTLYEPAAIRRKTISSSGISQSSCSSSSS